MRPTALRAMLTIIALAIGLAVGLGLKDLQRTHAQSSDAIVFTDSERLTVTFKPDESEAKKTVSLRNTTDTPLAISFCVLEEKDEPASCDTSPVTIEPTADHGIPPGEVMTFPLTFKLADETDRGEDDTKGINGRSGQLIAQSSSPLVSATRPITFQQADPSRFYGDTLYKRRSVLFWGILGLSAVFAIACIGWTVLKKPTGHEWKAPEIGEGFSTGFASSLTTIGSIFGTVFTSTLLPDSLSLIDKKGMTCLNIIFAAIILIAPFVYNAVGKEEIVYKKDGCPLLDPQLFDTKLIRGTTRRLFIASFLTLWAVLGELMTLAVLLEEIYQQRDLPRSGLVFLGLLIFVVALMVFPYAYQKLIQYAEEKMERKVCVEQPKQGEPQADSAGGTANPVHRWKTFRPI